MGRDVHYSRCMKKTLIVLVLTVLAVAVLGIPALIGSMIHGQAAESLDEALPDAEIQWDRGWFRSALNIAGEDLDASLEFGHASLSPPGWLTVDGRLILGELESTVDVSGRIRPMLDAQLEASAPSLTVPGVVTWRYAQPALEFSSGNDRIDLLGGAETLRIADMLGNELLLTDVELRGAMAESSSRDLEIRIGLSARRAGLPPSRVSIVFDQVNASALQQLVESLRELSATESGSASAGLAAIGLASAWQQLVERGLVLQLETLELDGDLQIDGQWVPAEGKLDIEGEGARDVLLAWWSRIEGLIEELPPSAAREATDRALSELERDGHVQRTGERIRVSLDPALIDRRAASSQGP